ncbi:leucine-rich repeat domain-containing protein, partial [Pseudoalteromonas sp. '520P1 No. 412']
MIWLSLSYNNELNSIDGLEQLTKLTELSIIKNQLIDIDVSK